MANVMVTCKDGPLDGMYVTVQDDVEAFTGLNNMPENSQYKRVEESFKDITDSQIIQAREIFNDRPITKVADFVYVENATE